MVEYFIEHRVLLLFLVMGIGVIVGRITIARVAIGPAAVLFTALVFSAIDERLVVPQFIGTFGLAVFAYTIGVVAGPSFFASLRRGMGPVAVVGGVLLASGLLAWALGWLLGLSPGITAGLYAGANTNTPGLAAAIEHAENAAEPTVAYSLTYAGGVILMLVAAQWSLQHKTLAAAERTNDDQLTNVSIAVTHDVPFTVEELSVTPHGHVVFSRLLSHDGDLTICTPDIRIQPGDTILAVGPSAALHYVTRQLGEISAEHLDDDRHRIDFRRVVVSERAHYGRTIAELGLWKSFGVQATRVRRLDHDFLATSEFVVQAGDRIRVAGPKQQIDKASEFLGGSEHGTADLNAVGLTVGMALGLIVGSIPVIIPGLGTMSLGHAAGPLVVGLVLGRVQRTGPFAWGLPHQAAEVLTQLGVLLFLAFAGGRAGSAFVDAIASPLGWKVILAGLALTAFHAVALVALCRGWLRLGGEQIGGTLAGSQTQPAVLAFANDATRSDERVALSYALVFPVAMVVKIAMCQVLAMM